MYEWGYEEKYDLLGIMMKEYSPKDYARSVELKSGFIIDVLKDNTIGAIEILDWSRSCGIRPHQVKNMNISVDIEIREYSVKITVTGEYKDKKHKFVGYCYK